MCNNSKGIFIEDISEDGNINSKFKIAQITKKYTRKGLEFLQIELKDKTGTIIGRKFSKGMLSETDKNIKEGFIYQIHGEYSKQFNSITIHNLEKCSESEYDELDYYNAPKDTKQLIENIFKTIDSIKDTDIKLILNLFFKDTEFVKEFYNLPAASYYHHNYKHGLLEHTVSVLSICKNITSLYPKLNKDLLYAGAILHDIGKIKVYKLNELKIEYTEEGKLMEHLFIGAEMVKDKTKNELIDSNKINQIIHLILSHHGEKKLGYGSPVDPQLPEAVVLHYADNLDAKIKNILG